MLLYKLYLGSSGFSWLAFISRKNNKKFQPTLNWRFTWFPVSCFQTTSSWSFQASSSSTTQRRPSMTSFAPCSMWWTLSWYSWRPPLYKDNSTYRPVRGTLTSRGRLLRCKSSWRVYSRCRGQRGQWMRWHQKSRRDRSGTRGLRIDMRFRHSEWSRGRVIRPSILIKNL